MYSNVKRKKGNAPCQLTVSTGVSACTRARVGSGWIGGWVDGWMDMSVCPLHTHTHTHTHTHIHYCNFFLYIIADNYINSLQRIQNNAARIVTNTHINPILQKNTFSTYQIV